jgi:hypothetical protein
MITDRVNAKYRLYLCKSVIERRVPEKRNRVISKNRKKMNDTNTIRNKCACAMIAIKIS